MMQLAASHNVRTMAGCLVDVVQEQVMHASSEKGAALYLPFSRGKKCTLINELKGLLQLLKCTYAKYLPPPVLSLF
jgi:hypothetical protein